MEQQTLDFERPISTSAEARAVHESSGAADTNRAKVLLIVQAYPGKTSRELSEISGMDLTELRRRLNDLLNSGQVVKGDPRPCSTNGNRMHVWSIAQ